MRQSRLLIGTTALALLAGTGMGLTQGMPRGEPSGPAINQPSGGDRSNPGNAQREGQGGQPGRAQTERAPKNSDQTTGQAPRAQGERSDGPAQRAQPGQNQQPGAGQSDRGKAGQRDRDETTGQQPRQPNQVPAARGEGERQPQANPQAGQGQTGQGQTGQSNDRSPRPETQGQAGAYANFTAEQRTRIRETIIQPSNAPRASNVNFKITVGTVVPRTVRVVPLPALVVDLEPSWRGYLYFLVGDEIIVVEPNSLRIVAVIAV